MGKKQWINHKGQEVPAAYVPKLDKQKERLTEKLLKKATDLNKKLTTFKADALSELDDFYAKLLQSNNVKSDGKGNYSITSFSKNIKIEVSVSERIEFDEQIEIAQIKINEYISSKTEGIDNDLLQLINQAFQTTKGKMDTKRILGLFSLKITAAKWIEAMELIKASMSRNTSKRYLRIWKKDAEGQYHSVDLNFSFI